MCDSGEGEDAEWGRDRWVLADEVSRIVRTEECARRVRWNCCWRKEKEGVSDTDRGGE